VIVVGMQPAMVARLSTCYPSSASFEIGKIFRLDENELLSLLIVVSEILPVRVYWVKLRRCGDWGSMHNSRGP
jgi:hypothetical protein